MQIHLLKLPILLSHRFGGRPALLRFQEQQLRRLLHHAYRHSPYYAARFSAAGIREEELDTIPLASLPTLTKAELIENYDQLVTPPRKISQELLRRHDKCPEQHPLPRGSHVIHSSGSTAAPFFFYYDEDAWGWVVAGIIRMLTLSLTPRRLFSILTGPKRLLYAAITTGSFGGSVLIESVARALGATVRKLDVNEPQENWKVLLTEFQPNILVGYPSSLQLLAEIAERESIPLHIDFALSSGEPLTPAQRHSLHEQFHCGLTNLYACSESLTLGTEVDQGFFLYDDLNLIEVTEKGEVYLTNLYNFAQPLIRYRLSDSLELLPHDGGPIPFTKCRIRGARAEEILWFSDGKERRDFLHPLLFEDFCMPGLRDYQLRQTASDRFEVIFAAGPEAETAAVQTMLEREIRAILRAHKLDFVRFEVRQVPHILPDPRTGKKKLAVVLPPDAAV